MRIERIVLLLLISMAAGEMFAARSSSRNLKSLKQREKERIIAEKEAQRAAEEAEQYADGMHFRPATEKVTFLGPKSGWGFVKTQSSYYSPSGKNLGELEAGTLFKYQDVKSTSSDDMLLSHLRDKTGWHGPYLLPCTGTAAYEGDPETVDIQIVADLRKYFLLKGDIENYREERLLSEYKKNPHYDAYQLVAKEYGETLDMARKMEQEAAKLTGIKKTRAYDELRKYKYEQAQIKVRMEQIGAKYKAWKKQHPVDIEKIEDEKLNAMQDKIAAIKSRIPHLIPEEN